MVISVQPSHLFQLDQRAVEILGVQEKHRLSMRADLGLSAAQYPRPFAHQPVAGGDDVIDLVTDVVDTAGRVLFQKPRDGRSFPERRQKLYLGIGQFDENHGDPVVGFVLRRAHICAQRIGVKGGCRRQIRHGNGHMVQTSDHDASLVVAMVITRAG